MIILQFATNSIGFSFEQRLTVALLLSMLISYLRKVTKVYLQIHKMISCVFLGGVAIFAVLNTVLVMLFIAHVLGTEFFS